MKIIVMSDSHGDQATVEKVVAKQADAHFHCGDSELASGDAIFQSMYQVRGNCDMDSTFPEEVVADIGDQKVYMAHGHRHNVKSSLMPILYAAQEKGANIALFGHSHLYGAEMSDGILLVNPGSTLLPRGGNPATYAVIEWADKITVTFKNMADEVIDFVEFERNN